MLGSAHAREDRDGGAIGGARGARHMDGWRGGAEGEARDEQQTPEGGSHAVFPDHGLAVAVMSASVVAARARRKAVILSSTPVSSCIKVR